MTTQKQNILIAEFMGFKFIPEYSDTVMHHSIIGGGLLSIEKANYHSDWNMLVPVIEKIEEKGIEVVTIKGNCCQIKSEFYLDAQTEETKIKATHKAIVEFIKWFNS